MSKHSHMVTENMARGLDESDKRFDLKKFRATQTDKHRAKKEKRDMRIVGSVLLALIAITFYLYLSMIVSHIPLPDIQ